MSSTVLRGAGSAVSRGARRRVIAHVAVTAGVLSLALFVAREALDVSELKAASEQVLHSRWGLVAFFAAYTAAFALRAAAWHVLLGGGPSLWRLHAILQTALLLNHLLPVKAGDAARPVLAARDGVPPSTAVVTTALARLVDFGALLVLALVFVPFAVSLDRGVMLLAPPAGIIVAGSAIALGLRQGLPSWLERTRGGRLFASARDALRAVDRGRLLVAAGLTLPSWVLEASALAVVAHATGAGLPLYVAIAATAFTLLFQVVHVTPGSVGIYEASMVTALGLYGVPLDDAAVLAATTHALKFVYSFTVAPLFALSLPAARTSIDPLRFLRGSSTTVKAASRLEIVMARLWNVVNEGKPFTPAFVMALLLLFAVPHAGDAQYWARWTIALVFVTPLALVFYRYDFPLRLRAGLWIMLGAFIAVFRYLDWTAVALALGAYFTFTVVVWGSVYYHLRIGMPLTNFTRFWRLVLENPDPTSGNFLEQAPKFLILILAHGMLVDRPEPGTVAVWLGFTAVGAIAAALVHQWFFTWPPAPSLVPTLLRNDNGDRLSRRVIVIAIDGCRADRLREAHTPCIDRLRAGGTEFTNVRTVYPARTVTCFSSMLTGAPPRRHGMRSNFVPSLGVKCESIFDVLRARGLRGRLVGIAHLIDAFGERDVCSVTAVTHNDEIDAALLARAKLVLESERPDLLVLQLLSVDQTGHARGSYNREYLRKIEETDRAIGEFLDWCRNRGLLDGATVIVTADHGQGIGIGGHGHLSPPELIIPCVIWGEGAAPGVASDEPRSIMDIAATIAFLLGVPPPEASVGQVLVPRLPAPSGPLTIIIPARDEEQNIGEVLGRIPRQQLGPLRVIVVDDGSTDRTAAIARAAGADIVVSHGQGRGLGAALRTGLEQARMLNARAAVYLDGDGEYDPREIPALLAPIERGEADYVVGSRFLGHREGQTWHRALANRLFTILLSILAGRRLTDGQSGFRAFSKDALAVAEIIHDYNYAQVLTLDLLHKGMRLREVPISYRRRRAGRSFVRMSYLWRVPVGITRELLSQ